MYCFCKSGKILPTRINILIFYVNMRFAAHLAAHITPEWRIQYINYEELKQQLYEVVENAPPVAKINSNMIARYFVDADEVFFSVCEKELSKVNTFYSEKIAEAMRKFASLQHDLASAHSMDVIEKPSYYTKNSHKELPKKPSIKKLRKLEIAFSEFYLSLVLLQNYQTLNFSGFRKILKKHDKLFSVKRGEFWRRDNVDSAPFYINKDTDRLIEETENLVTTYLEEGNRERAMKRLHVPPIGEHQSLWTTFKLGLLMGTFISLFCIVVFIAFFRLKHEDYKIVIRLYRSTFFITLFLLLCGINVYGWRTSGVNHILIFEINPRSHLTEQHIMEISMIFGIFWTLSVMGFVFSEYIGIPRLVNPLVLVVSIFIFLLNPFRMFFHEARFWFLRIMGRILMAPFFKVGFADFWLAEQMTSMAPILIDLYVFVRFYFFEAEDWTDDKSFVKLKKCIAEVTIIQPILLCLPAWFRIAQCFRRYYDTRQTFPHIFSSLKYCTIFFIVLFAYWNIQSRGDGQIFMIPLRTHLYFYLWMVSVVMGTTFMFLWDVKLDWGLLSGGFLDNKFLRDQILYGNEGYYFVAIAMNFLLRFSWAFTLSLPEIAYPSGEIFAAIAMLLEILRRFLWNFFRLENEHLNNCGEFRAIRDISIVPLETIDRDQHVLLRMMDEPDGVTNRRQKITSPSTGTKTDKKED